MDNTKINAVIRKQRDYFICEYITKLMDEKKYDYVVTIKKTDFLYRKCKVILIKRITSVRPDITFQVVYSNNEKDFFVHNTDIKKTKRKE